MKLASGTSRLEDKAIQAHAQRLGLTVGADGTVDLSKADVVHGTMVSGGAQAVRQAAALDRDKDTLSLSELHTLKPNLIGKLFAPAETEAVAKATLAATASALDAAADQLIAFADRFVRNDFHGDPDPIARIEQLARRFDATGKALGQALDDKVLGWASSEDIRTLAVAYQRFNETLARLAQDHPASTPQYSGLDEIFFRIKENYGSDYGAIPWQEKVMKAADEARAARGKIEGFAAVFGAA
ncbi:MAG: hypothetical protein U1E65_11245 [Myxococcota bacterium]